MASSKKSLLKSGYLLKRQRARRKPTSDLKRLRFQLRYITLDEGGLHYFDDSKATREEKGSFEVERIKIIESVPDETFGKTFCFQIGDKDEVMYFKAKSDQDRKQWLEAFRIACVTLNKNEMYDWYHGGAFGKEHTGRWSCCNSEKNSKGCKEATNKASQRSRASSFSQQWKNGNPSLEVAAMDGDMSSSMLTHSNWGEDDTTLYHERLSPRVLELESTDEAVKQESESMKYRSFDSGLDMESKLALGSSQASLYSGKSESPASYRRQHPSFKSLVKIPEVGMTDGKSGVISSIFSGTSTLITASDNGQICMAHVDDSMSLFDQKCLSYMPLRAIDIWKTYLAIGSPSLKVIDLDTETEKALEISVIGDHEQPAQLVSFSPEGQLLSYKKSESSSLCIWPCIDLLWPKLPDFEVKTDIELLTIEDAQQIFSLSVSPDPDQTLVAVIIQLRDIAFRKRLRIYDYRTKKMQEELKLQGTVEAPNSIMAFHPYGGSVVVGDGGDLLIYDIKSRSFVRMDQLTNGQVITSLCFHPTGHHLTIGLQSGDIRSYRGISKLPQLVASHSKPSEEPQVYASSITYSRDCQTLAVGYSNGKVKLWQVPLFSGMEISHESEILLLRQKETHVTNKRVQIFSQDDKYSISVPPGAVSDGETVTIEHGIIPCETCHPFEFPSGIYPVSAILSINLTSDQNFLKPITIALPHFMLCETPDDCNNLTILKACRVVDTNGVPSYTFKEMPREYLSLFSLRNKRIGYASYSTTHCCYWCVGTYVRSDIEKALLCLTEAKVKTTPEMESKEMDIRHYCLSYYLATCLKAIEEQYPCNAYDLKHLAVMFANEENPTMCISIENEENLSGWIFKLQGGDKINKKDLSFLDFNVSCPVFVRMCQNRQYPPRFILEIDGHKATKNADIRVVFHGAKDYFTRKTPILLKIPLARGHPSIGSEHPFQSAMSEFTDEHPKKLAFYLFSKNVIKEEDYQYVVQCCRDPESDPEKINIDLLMKVYRIVKKYPQKVYLACQALKKLKDKAIIAEKLAADSETYEKTVRMSRSGSAESSSSQLCGSFSSAQERLSVSEIETGSVPPEPDSSVGDDIDITGDDEILNNYNQSQDGWYQHEPSSNDILPFLSPLADNIGDTVT